MLAIAFGPPTMAEALAGLPRIREEADCVELRLDLFEEPFDLAVLLRERGDLPVVVTLRPPNEGGKSPLPPDSRLEVLLRAAELGADYVDLEGDATTAGARSAQLWYRWWALPEMSATDSQSCVFCGPTGRRCQRLPSRWVSQDCSRGF